MQLYLKNYNIKIYFTNKSDENGPIKKLNKITNNIGDSFIFDYGNASIYDVMSTAIDTIDNDAKLHIGIISATGYYLCLAQKANNNYASGIVFGYGSRGKLLYQIKVEGTWQTIREI